MCTVLLPPGDNPIAVNKYISHHTSNNTPNTLDCNSMTVLPKPKHAATLLKQSNFSNYSVVMSHCLSLFVFPRLTIYRAVHLITAICHAMPRRFVNVSRRFEWCKLQRLKSSRQRLQTYGTRAQNGTRKCFFGKRPSMLSHFFYFARPASLYCE
jgi:hypothetical protein